MSLNSYVSYLNNILRYVDGYKPLQLTTNSNLEEVLNTARDIDDISYIDTLLAHGQSEMFFFTSYGFLYEPLEVDSLSRIKKSNKSPELIESIIENLGELADEDYEVDSSILQSSGITDSYTSIVNQFQEDFVDSGLITQIEASDDEYEDEDSDAEEEEEEVDANSFNIDSEGYDMLDDEDDEGDYEDSEDADYDSEDDEYNMFGDEDEEDDSEDIDYESEDDEYNMFDDEDEADESDEADEDDSEYADEDVETTETEEDYNMFDDEDEEDVEVFDSGKVESKRTDFIEDEYDMFDEDEDEEEDFEEEDVEDEYDMFDDDEDSDDDFEEEAEDEYEMDMDDEDEDFEDAEDFENEEDEYNMFGDDDESDAFSLDIEEEDEFLGERTSNNGKKEEFFREASENLEQDLLYSKGTDNQISGGLNPSSPSEKTANDKLANAIVGLSEGISNFILGSPSKAKVGMEKLSKVAKAMKVEDGEEDEYDTKLKN